jgi:hypothetical protein
MEMTTSNGEPFKASADAAPEENRTADPGGAPDASPSTDPRVRRIQDLIHESIAAEDPLTAVIGAELGDIKHHQYYLNKMIARICHEAEDPLGGIADFVPAISTLVKLGNYSNQLTQQFIKLKQHQQAARAEENPGSRSEKTQKRYPPQKSKEAPGGPMSPAQLIEVLGQIAAQRAAVSHPAANSPASHSAAEVQAPLHPHSRAPHAGPAPPPMQTSHPAQAVPAPSAPLPKEIAQARSQP